MTGQKDLRYLEAGVPELESYLSSRELYYPIGLDLPQLTLGGILLCLARPGGKVEKYQLQVEAIRSKWPVAWEKKSEREVRARGELWMNYLAEYRADPKSEARLYPQNVRYRAMLSLLGHLNHESDPFLRSVFIDGGFVWEPERMAYFSHEHFWYLYGTIKERI